MNEKKEVLEFEVSPAIDDKHLGASQAKLKDFFDIQSKGLNIDLAGLLEAYVCLGVGSGSEEA